VHSAAATATRDALAASAVAAAATLHAPQQQSLRVFFVTNFWFFLPLAATAAGMGS